MSHLAYGLTASNLPQDPYYPQITPQGPSFLDTGACLCALQKTPTAKSKTALWHCIGNQTQNVYTTRTGKWFRTIHGGTKIHGPIDDASNGPQIEKTFIWDSGSFKQSSSVDSLSLYDRACTGINQTTFSTAFYRAAQEIADNQDAVDAAPCWRQGAFPIQLQDVTEWAEYGCREGFLCRLCFIFRVNLFEPSFGLLKRESAKTSEQVPTIREILCSSTAHLSTDAK